MVKQNRNQLNNCFFFKFSTIAKNKITFFYVFETRSLQKCKTSVPSVDSEPSLYFSGALNNIGTKFRENRFNRIYFHRIMHSKYLFLDIFDAVEQILRSLCMATKIDLLCSRLFLLVIFFIFVTIP